MLNTVRILTTFRIFRLHPLFPLLSLCSLRFSSVRWTDPAPRLSHSVTPAASWLVSLRSSATLLTLLSSRRAAVVNVVNGGSVASRVNGGNDKRSGEGVRDRVGYGLSLFLFAIPSLSPFSHPSFLTVHLPYGRCPDGMNVVNERRDTGREESDIVWFWWFLSWLGCRSLPSYPLRVWLSLTSLGSASLRGDD